MKIVAIIPARSGSKGLKDKNVRLLNGMPLLYWIINTAKKSKYIDRIICSTDDPEYAEIAKKSGAEVPFLRPKEISLDSSVDIQFLTHATEFLINSDNYIPDLILRLPPTSPFLSHTSIDRAIEMLINDRTIDSVRAVTKVDKHPFKMWKFDTDGQCIVPFVDSESLGYREAFNMGRQNLPEVYIQTGAMEVLRLSTLIGQKSMAGKKVLPLLVDDRVESLDIDDKLDFEFAEYIFNKINEK